MATRYEDDDLYDDPRFDQTHDVRGRYRQYKRNRPTPTHQAASDEKPYLVFDARRGDAYTGNVAYVYARSKDHAITKARDWMIAKVPREHLVVVGTWKMSYKSRKYKRAKRSYRRR